MKITRISKNIKCDTVLCSENAEFELSLNSFKGNSYLCPKCFNLVRNLFKRLNDKNEK